VASESIFPFFVNTQNEQKDKKNAFLEKVSAADSICRPVTYKNLIHREPVVVVVVGFY
jgi:hypothetical protein